MTVANQIFSREEIRELTRPSNLRGAAAVLFDWAVIAGCFALAGLYPNALTILFAIVVLGGRQLGLAVLMHEASHRSLFTTAWLNRFVGHWLCGAPIWNDVERYRRHHLHHHVHTGSERDPDMCLVDPFPTTPASLLRKLARDVLGLTGVRRVVGLLAMDFDVLTYSASGNARRPDAPVPRAAAIRHGLARLFPVVLTNAALALILHACGALWLYALWAVAWMTTFSLFVRVRSIAEHACTERGEDPFRNTRTIRASWLARAFVAPHGVGYHLEHHLVPTVPYFRLPALRAKLEARGLLEGTPVGESYVAVLRRAAGAGQSART